MGRIEEAKQRCEKALEMGEKLLQTDPENVAYQSAVGTMLNNLSTLLSYTGRIEEAKQRYEKALEMREKLLQTDPENVAYQSDVGTTLNNLGTLLFDMGRIEEAKQWYEKALEIYTEPMQYLTIKTKVNTILNLINLDWERAEEESNPFRRVPLLKEAFSTCIKNRDFFVMHGMQHERKLAMEVGLKAYVEYSMLHIQKEPNSEYRTKEYEKVISAINKFK